MITKVVCQGRITKILKPGKWIIATLLGNSFFLCLSKETPPEITSLRIQQLSEQKIKSTEFSEKATLLQVLDEGASVLFALS